MVFPFALNIHPISISLIFPRSEVNTRTIQIEQKLFGNLNPKNLQFRGVLLSCSFMKQLNRLCIATRVAMCARV